MTTDNTKGGRLRRVNSEGSQQSRGAAAPRAVTRGESLNSKSGGVIIDHLAFTFDGAELSIPKILDWLHVATGHRFSGIPGGGIHGFTDTLRLVAHVEAGYQAVGFLAWGGASQAGRAWVQLSGAGCALVRDWSAVYTLIVSGCPDAKITRVDLAKDLLEGERTVEDAVEAYKGGAFGVGGRMPSSSLTGDWINVKGGRTVYIGKARNGKMLRVYEKGRQLGNADSPWTRFEVQLGNRSRVIPADVLLRPGDYFAGAYPYLAELVEEHPELIKTTAQEGSISLSRLLGFLRSSYGRVINAALQVGADPAELIHEVRLLGLPRRVSLSSMSGAVTWSDVSGHLSTGSMRC